jgi:hypothetical protein
MAAIDDEYLLRRDDRDYRRRRDAPNAPARPDLEHRRVVRTEVRKDPLDRAAVSTREGETDAVGEPVAGDGARRVEPPALAQGNRHLRTGPRFPAMRNSLR